ncbi:LacI family transcriptional regulator [Sinobaca qinghaiensis]|uniref:LacI family transcriptional regulator n=1 Tax=Sinobaca qinghaiensis TaxID=342944 RepID=A0A419UZL3_9BACL|nr:LacI family DNA-binding transcriptional regulator [Sinobaca qinghaiensis]RKD71114.1 LacI family transcriptional regulator [Sinobaca qinghaiensis]
MTTIKDIARMADVSRTTVSRVLNESPAVSKEARERVHRIIEETGYIPSEHAKSLRTKKTKVIGVILPRLSTETTTRVVSGIDRELGKKGFQILLASSDLNINKEVEHIKLLESRRVDGIILLATNTLEPIKTAVSEAKVPVIVVGQEFPDAICLMYDDFRASYDLTNLFIKKGYKKIGLISVDEKDEAVGYWRKKGYIKALEEAGLPIEKSWQAEGAFTIESGYSAMKAIWEQSDTKPDSIVSATDRMAIGAADYLNDVGVAIPDDIGIAGFGASELSQYAKPALTTVDYYNEQGGIEAARILLEEMENPAVKKNKKNILKYGLIERNSL